MLEGRVAQGDRAGALAGLRELAQAAAGIRRRLAQLRPDAGRGGRHAGGDATRSSRAQRARDAQLDFMQRAAAARCAGRSAVPSRAKSTRPVPARPQLARSRRDALGSRYIAAASRWPTTTTRARSASCARSPGRAATCCKRACCWRWRCSRRAIPSRPASSSTTLVAESDTCRRAPAARAGAPAARQSRRRIAHARARARGPAGATRRSTRSSKRRVRSSAREQSVTLLEEMIEQEPGNEALRLAARQRLSTGGRTRQGRGAAAQAAAKRRRHAARGRAGERNRRERRTPAARARDGVDARREPGDS